MPAHHNGPVISNVRPHNMNLRKLYSYQTKAGTFFIAQTGDGRYHPVFDDESLGSYSSARAAAGDLAGGHTFSVRGVEDTSVLGIPEDIAGWSFFTSE